MPSAIAVIPRRADKWSRILAITSSGTGTRLLSSEPDTSLKGIGADSVHLLGDWTVVRGVGLGHDEPT
jgi:hypothetical protein